MVKFDSFDKNFKVPFGPTKILTKQSFFIQTRDEEQVTKAELVVYQDEHWEHPEEIIPMQQRSNGHYQASFYASQAGLYFYFFHLYTADGEMYYGCVDGGYGGVGQVYQERSAVQMYQLTVFADDYVVPEWYADAIFYHIFVDRFNNGNLDGHVNEPKADSFIYGTHEDLPYYVKNEQGEIVRWDFYGGNFKGIIQKLPVLKEMGFTALYLSPIFESRSNHRYDTGNYLKVDGVLGTLQDFDDLIKAVHQAGMHVILDGVFNHVGADSMYFNATGRYPEIGAAQDPASPYYDWFSFKKFPTEYVSWWGVADLPAIRKDSKSFQNFIAGKTSSSVINYWTGRGVDGWRLDVADELTDEFIFKIRRRLEEYGNKILVGEVWEDASHKIAYGKRRHYLQANGLQAVMNYPLRQLIIDLLTGKITPVTMVQQYLTLKQNYPPAIFDHNFNNIGTHDTKRVLSILAEDLQKLKLAFFLLLTLPGVPCIYYGDEVGMTGGADPDNRRFYPWSKENLVIKSWVKQLLDQRHADPLLKNDAAITMKAQENCLVYQRSKGEESELFVLNPTSTEQKITVQTKKGMQEVCLAAYEPKIISE
ncbi:glycoside hydrolase family 13 protein [Ligilactobacillus acidipiscis]|uniref:glycoside hydrolase family 13 protein n=1 Tax=Ligilactobacillus acidipiscis TaxID=89059 RepID=UPI0023F99330|nr:glycoside hydrolase family 13 protein [Ligilactobacillus acidipiscis]WEV57087.1 glycoside hydrolase family 13 protein [Ligilactobacillus acidipiscis]